MTITLFDGLQITVEVSWSTGPYDAASYTDITTYVRDFHIRSGRAKQFETFSPATLELTVNNTDRRFDPLHAGGAYYPNVLPRKQVRVSAVWSATTYRLFHGYIDALPQIGEPSNQLGWATITATDGRKLLSSSRCPTDPTNPVGDGETAAVRIGRLLDYAGWPAALRDLDADSPALVALVPNGQSIMGEIDTATAADQGKFYFAGDGKATYRGHRWQLTNNLTASATLGDGAGEIPYTDLVLSFDDVRLYNRAKGTSGTGTVLDLSDATSVAAYGESTRDFGTLGIVNDNVLRNTLEWTLAAFKDPHLRVDSLNLNPRNSPATIYPVVFGGIIGARWTAKRRPQNVGSAISQDVVIEGVEHSCRVTQDEAVFESVFSLSEAPSVTGGGNYWIIGTSKLGSSGTAVWA